MTAALIAVCVLCAVLAVPAALWARSTFNQRRRVLGGYVGQRVTVHQVDGSSVRGTLARVGSDALVLRDAAHLGPQGDVVPLDGAQVMALGRLDFFQVLPPDLPTVT